MAGMNFVRSREQWPFGVFLFGLLFLLLAVIGTFTGKTYGKGSVDRTKDPTSYWLTLAVQYLGGAFLIWYWASMLPH
jgi:hypothetical protein